MVSVIASLQNSVPLQAMVPRAKDGAADFQSDCVQLFRERLGIDRGNVHDQQVLHVGGAEFAAGKTLGEIRGSLHLVGGDAAAQHNRSDITKPGLLLRVNSDVIAINVVRRMFFGSGIECEPDSLVQFGQKAFGRPSVAQEEELQTGAFAMLAQDLGIAEELGNALDHRHDLIPADERVQARAEIGFGGKPTGNSQRESNFRLAAQCGA